MYTTIIFDLSDVLIRGLFHVEKTLSPRLGVPEPDILKALFAAHTFQFFCGSVTEQVWLDRILRENSWDSLSADELAHIIRLNFDRRIDGTEPILRQLAANYELALLSDHAREWIDYIKPVHPFLSIIPRQFFSFDLGHTKREAAAFTLTLEHLDRRAQDCLFIDDLESNIGLAASLGLQGIQFKDSSQLLAALHDHGITLD
jgi:HAD superfamily hydrolase (TIGR01509 family)